MTGVIILCRFSSQRLPGKVLKQIGDKTLLQHALDAWRTLAPDVPIVVATSNQSTDDPIDTFCKQQGVPCFRGDLDNVAGRFLACAKARGFSSAIRFNGDNFFVDKHLLDEFLNVVKSGKHPFISNVKDRTYPKGMSLEAIDMSLYEQEIVHFNDRHKEHVTLYFYENPPLEGYYLRNSAVPEAAGIQLAVDTPEDFARTERMYGLLHTNVADLRSIYDSYLKAT